MAYNPFDQMIFEDPAYLTDPNKAKEQIQEETRGIANIIARTAGPIAGVVTNPEKYQQTLDQEQRNKQILEQLGITNRQLNRDEIERAKAAGYVPLTTGQALGKISGFLYSDLVKGSDNIRAGVDYYDLPENERMGVAMGLLDMADIALIPAVFKKLATIGVQKLGKTNLKTIAQDPELQKQFPNETKEILTITGGGFTPTGVVRAAETGTGPASSTPTISSKIRNYLSTVEEPKTITQVAEATGVSPQQVRQFKTEKTEINLPYLSKLTTDRQMGKTEFLLNFFSDSKATIPNRRVFEEQGITRTDIGNFLNANPQYKSRVGKGKDSKTIDRLESGIEKLKAFEGEKIPSKELERIFGLGGKGYLNTVLNNKDTVAKGLLSQDQVDYIKSFQTNLSRAELDNNKKLSTIATDLKNNPEFQNLGPTEISNKYKIPLMNLQTAISKDPELYALVAKDQKLIGTPDTQMSISLIRKILDPKADDVDVSIITDLYRGTKNIEDYTPDQFLELFKKQNPNYKKTGFDKNTKKAYKELEDKRLEIQKESFNFFDKVRKDPRYSKYLKDSDRLQFGFQKAHAFPIDETTQMNRFENMAQMSDMIFVSDMTSNVRLQKRFDGDLIKIGNLGSKENMDKLATIPTNADIKSMGINLPKIIERLKEYGINVVPEEFQNMRQLIFGKDKGIVDQINNLYQKFDTGSVIPIGKTNYGLVGKNPKGISPEKRLNNLKNRFMKILDDQVLYEKTNGKQGKPIMRQPRKDGQEGGFIVGLKDGGEVKPVRMAMGGDPLQNINQQQFTPDPAIDGDSAFQQAVKSENLYAFNPAKIIKFFGDKVPGVFTPSKRNKNMELMSDAPSAPGTTLPVEQPIQDYDFAFKSFTLDKVNSKNAPKAAKPQDWINFLQGGDVAPKAEILDSGLFQYMEDFERYYPNQKITREQITDFYEQSPIANLQVKVKTDRDGMTPYGPQDQQVMGIAKHKNAGNARIDDGGENYREIVIEAGALPGEEKPFVSSGHYQEPNVLVFSRVADYKNADGQNVSVIQEMQTDLLTKVRKEQERLAATIGEAKVKLAANQRVIETGDQYRMENATQNIQQLSQQIPKLEQLAETKLIKPYPLTVAKELIPTYEKQMLDLQQEINALAQAGVDRTDPEFLMKINQIEQQQQGTLNELLNLNRSSNFESLTEGIKVPTTNSTEELQQIAQNQSSYHGTRNIETFPPIPFNNQADYVDLILKATIKDAENRGINKIAIMPADVGANPRWSKTSDDARKKFQNLYDKVGVQQLKNIAKKYGGNVEIEKISDPNKSTMGLKVSKPSLNRDSFDFLKDVDIDRRAVENDPEGARNFLDEEIVRIASDLGDKSVIYRKETAPGQTMDYYVKVLTYPDEKGSRFRLDPLKDGDVDTDAQILIEDYNPSLVDMFVLTMDEGKQKAPMYMFKKKEGGIIPEDRLVSITDIYGDY